jgi:transposase
MGRRQKILTEIWGFRGWVIDDLWFESAAGHRLMAVAGFGIAPEARLVLRVRRRWAGRCHSCGAICRKAHKQLPPRRWSDLPWAGRPCEIEYAPGRMRCERCGFTGVEWLAFAEPYQRQTQRFQQRLALEAASMPIHHVAVLHGLDWGTVRRVEELALTRWQATRPPRVLRHVGVDEKYLGRRGRHPERYVTIVSDNETGEPVWIGFGRSEKTLACWLATLSPAQKAAIKLFIMDMHEAFLNAVRADPTLANTDVVHDPFHVMKRAAQAMDELRREIFFRAGPELRAIGRGKRWLLLRAWENTTMEQRQELKSILSLNGTLARFHQVIEELRQALHAPDRNAMGLAFTRILLRTQRRKHSAIRKFHDSLERHCSRLYGLAEHRPATGRVEALNNNWETLVRRARGYRRLDYLLLKLQFATVYPIRTEHGVARFLALGLPSPARSVA